MVQVNETFEAFMARREAISNDYINGKAESLLGIATKVDPATFFPPTGKHVQGAERVNTAHGEGANIFGTGSTGRFEVLQSSSSGDLGFWTGIQHAEVSIRGKDERVPMQLRTTEVFRREGGEWKLIHRHADMLESKEE